MIDKSVAYDLAREYVDKRAIEGFKQAKLLFLDRKRPDLAEKYEFIELVIDNEATQERAFGWVFFWNSKEYYATRDFGKSIVGNGPIIIDRCDGSVHELMTAGPAEKFIEDYARNRTQNCE